MPHLDAKALETDPKGLSFLRDVLRSSGAEKACKRTIAGKPRRPEPTDARISAPPR